MVSPCPTLKVVGAVSKAMIAREELKRMKEHPGFDEDGNPIILDFDGTTDGARDLLEDAGTTYEQENPAASEDEPKTAPEEKSDG